MTDYPEEKWVDLYRTALLELKRVAISGRISDARSEIAKRLETLKQHPGLHKQEYEAIQDALSGLRSLEQEEERLAAEDKKRVLEEAAGKLQSIAHKFTDPPNPHHTE